MQHMSAICEHEHKFLTGRMRPYFIGVSKTLTLWSSSSLDGCHRDGLRDSSHPRGSKAREKDFIPESTLAHVAISLIRRDILYERFYSGRLIDIYTRIK